MVENEWYEETRRSRAGWRALYRLGMENCRDEQSMQDSMGTRDVMCTVCLRNFRRESDQKRHKCVDERSKPVWEQQGAAQCQQCHRWFKNKGRLAVHSQTLDSLEPS